MNRRTTIIFSALATAVVAIAFAAFMWLKEDTAKMAKIDIGMPFVLASSKGGTVDSSTLIGKPYAIFFGFTHCPEVCPTTLYEMSNLFTKLGDQAKDFRVFFVTVDPERDTVAAMKDYISNFDPRIEALVPTAEELPKLAKAFRIYYAKVPTSDGGYTMDHTALMFLMDEKGQFAGTIAYGEAAAIREKKVRNLLGARS